MPLTHEWTFYEVMWRAWARNAQYPFPWWVQQYFRRWTDLYDGGLFDSKEAAFSSNASFRYWNLVGVKDAAQETLVGQAGEIEPVYDKYVLSFFLFDPASRTLSFPQRWLPDLGETLTQELESGHIPVVVTRHRSALGLDVAERVFATVVGPDRKAVTIARFALAHAARAPREIWFGVAIGAAGPSGLQRHDKAGRYLEDGRVTYLRYVAAERRVEVGTSAGPAFDRAPAAFGTYGGDGAPDAYLSANPFTDLVTSGRLNGRDVVGDAAAGLCSAAFVWPVTIGPGDAPVEIVVRLPVDDFRGADLQLVGADPVDALEAANRQFWTSKLDGSGLQFSLPGGRGDLVDLYKTCRANLLILADDGQIHPGPTIYDSFWVRDSSIEGIAAALAGDGNLAERQFGWHYPGIFNQGPGQIGPAARHGFFGGPHERDDREWDANGEALWAFGRFDRIRGTVAAFGARMFSPYVIEAARWLRDNRSAFGLLHSGWSAEHLGDKDKPHYWDDLWAVAGLWEAAQLAERLGAGTRAELWSAYQAMRDATRDSILWAVARQREQGHWETFIPTGPADVGRVDSTIVGSIAYFHPCRLYMGAKLGDEADRAARMTLETIWAHFVAGGIQHAPWNAYGPYLTLQLAHAFLLIGDLARMERCLAWAAGAAYARVSRIPGNAAQTWRVVAGAWNEQHAYPIATDFSEFPASPWYMGDIPHGWASAELMLLVRDMLLFEADEDRDPHLYVAAGIPAAWFTDGATVEVRNAPTLFGAEFGYRLAHDASSRTIDLRVLQSLPRSIRLVLPVRVGRVTSVEADGRPVPVTGPDVNVPGGTRRVVVRYQ